MENSFVRFFNCSIPVTGCNLRCDYCYLIQRGDEKILDFKETSEGFKYPVEHMLAALTPERLGGVCAFHICGDGETLLWSEIDNFALGLFEMGHFVSFTSNCTVTQKIKQFTQFPEEYRQKMFFKCSFHYREFKRLGLLEQFAENVNSLADAGISYSVEVVTNDYVLDNIDEIKQFSMDHFGALPHVLTQRSELERGKFPRMKSIMDRDTYGATWNQFDSGLFNYQLETFERKHKEFCYAGVYTLQMHLESGDVFPCPGNNRKIVNLFEDISMKPTFVPVGHNCPLDNCWFEFVTHILGGDDREIQSDIYFKDFRNRKRIDNGKEWLSATMKEAYGHRCSEFHEPLSAEKAMFVDNIMKAAYGNEVDQFDILKCSKFFQERMEAINAHSIIIYGMSSVGKWIKELSCTAGIDVVCAIDKNYERIEADISVIPLCNDLPMADLIIVTAYGSYHEIYNLITKYTDIPVMSVLDIV